MSGSRRMGYRRAVRVALGGSAIGGAAVLAVGAAMGSVTLFLLLPGFALMLVAIGVASALLVGVVAWLTGLLGPRGVRIAAAVLTFAVFAALMLQMYGQGASSGRW